MNNHSVADIEEGHHITYDMSVCPMTITTDQHFH